MKQKFLKDLGIDLDGTTEDLLQQFDLNGFLDQISDNRLKEKEKIINDIQDKNENNKNKENKEKED